MRQCSKMFRKLSRIFTTGATGQQKGQDSITNKLYGRNYISLLAAFAATRTIDGLENGLSSTGEQDKKYEKCKK